MIRALRLNSKIWWGVFFGTLIGVLLLAPDSRVSYGVRDLFYRLQDTVVAALDASYDAHPQVFGLLVVLAFALLGAFILYVRYFAGHDERRSQAMLAVFVILLGLAQSIIGMILTTLGKVQ